MSLNVRFSAHQGLLNGARTDSMTGIMQIRIVLLLGALCVAGIFSGLTANATPAFATKEKKACNYCHLKPSGGENWGFRGLYYHANKFSFKGFDEKKEAKKAGVKVGAMGKDAKPTKKY